ncbi:hypothetical protein BN988_01071 [Oceanobacillus picturae]|uniref:Uncharacterized protein n=1 Tax=Oceanobacillus picturae TaxID=171693 RepID=W9AAW1_9BACI|nr:hypothetical protein [Oceanobacillus picturae]CDO02598.1 hypothetical protein BN988_01071 [Oceanobacillus picturae]
MLLSTVILGWIGIGVFVTILLTFMKLMKNKEQGLLHVVMGFMYAMWLPLPFALYFEQEQELLLTGSIFGFVYLLMLVITMGFQAGHIVHIVKQEQSEIWEERATWMLDTFSSSYENLAGVFKSVWSIFLAISFWLNGETWIAILMSLFSLMIIYYVNNLVNQSTIKRIKFLEKLKPNPFIYNIEALLFFLTLMIYITMQLLE